MGWPQAGDPAHQAVLRHKAALSALIRAIQCSEAAIPVMLQAALRWDGCARAQAVIWRHRCLGKPGGNRGNLRASPSPFPQEKRPPSAADGHVPIA